MVIFNRGWLKSSITLRSRRHSIDTEASATLKGRRGFRVDAVTLRADLVALGGFLMHPTTTNMNIASTKRGETCTGCINGNVHISASPSLNSDGKIFYSDGKKISW